MGIANCGKHYFGTRSGTLSWWHPEMHFWCESVFCSFQQKWESFKHCDLPCNIRGSGLGVPMSRVKLKKRPCRMSLSLLSMSGPCRLSKFALALTNLGPCPDVASRIQLKKMPCRLSILRIHVLHVALSNLRNGCVALSILRV